MYSLDLKIFGSASDRAEYDGERMAMIEQADLLFARITTTLEHWAAHSDWWTEEEWDAIDKIRFSASRHDPRRHRKKETKRETGPVFATHEMSAFKFDAAKYDAQELEAWERPRYGTHELEAPERA